MKRPASRTSTGLLSIARVGFLGVSIATALFAPDRKVLSTPVEPIPESPYKTWSLFLINNPQWVLAESNEKIKRLYDEFEAFGKAIGPDHVAVWFWSKSVAREPVAFNEAVDVARSARFCEKLKLAPSGGPYILVTSDFPGRGQMNDSSTFLPTPLERYYTVSLNNKSADEIMELLTRVADKITTDRLADLNSRSERYWSAWQRAFEGIRDFLSSRQMTVSIKTPFSDVQIR